MMQWKVNWRTTIAALAVLALAVSASHGAVKHVYVHSPSLAGLVNADADFVIKTDDLLSAWYLETEPGEPKIEATDMLPFIFQNHVPVSGRTVLDERPSQSVFEIDLGRLRRNLTPE